MMIEHQSKVGLIKYCSWGKATMAQSQPSHSALMQRPTGRDDRPLMKPRDGSYRAVLTVN
jgi:hypothetical protein